MHGAKEDGEQFAKVRLGRHLPQAFLFQKGGNAS